jgi:hypothetical protein
MTSYLTDVRGFFPFVRWSVRVYNPRRGIEWEESLGWSLTRSRAWDAADDRVGELLAEREPDPELYGWMNVEFDDQWDNQGTAWTKPPEGWPDPPEDAA